MCEPLTIAATVAAAGTVYSGVSQYQQGKYNAAVNEQNAVLAEKSAQDAISQGEADVSRYRTQIKALKGKQRAAIGSANIELTGSPLDLMVDTATVGELDIQTIRNNAARDAFGFRTQGLNYRAQAGLDRFAGRTGAIGTLLTGSAQAYGIYRQGQ